jgi:hypothetical protein
MNNKIISAIIVLTLLLTSFGVFAYQENYNKEITLISERIIVSKPNFVEKGNYVSLDIDESDSNLIQTGRPLLPIINKVFYLPLGSKIIDVNVMIDYNSYNLNNTITPCPPPKILNEKNNQYLSEEIIIDETIYNSDVFYPKEPYNIHKSAGLNNNEHVLFYNIQVVPQYNPHKNIILIPNCIDISIEYISSEKPLFTSNNEYEMVIIAPEEFSKDLDLLIDHKNFAGVSTFLKSTEEIFRDYNGVDKQEKIKYFIKDAIEQYGIKYVFLIGDINHIPIRTTGVIWNYFGDLVVPNVLTDLYYSDIYDENGSFSIWDTNQDGIYSEIQMIMNNRPYNETLEIIDEIDGNPDVIIGRLPCSNNRDVKNIVKKIIVYESKTYGRNWFNKIILMGGDTFPNVGGINEGEYVTNYISSIMPDFEPIRLWTSLDTFNPMKINFEISKGAGFVSYSGHGFEYGFATSEPDSSPAIFYYVQFILGILNGNRYPIMYFDACLTASLDYNNRIFGIDFPCLAWSMIKKHYGGAVACIGSTRVGFGGFAGDPFIAGTSCLHRYFFEAYESGTFLGDMFIQAQQSFIEEIINNVIYDPLTLQEFTLLGDPSLKVGGYPIDW